MNDTINLSKSSSVSSKEDLLDECADLNLPVSRYEPVGVIQKQIQAAYDEMGSIGGVIIDPDLEKSNIYIGKVNLFNKLKLRKFIPFL